MNVFKRWSASVCSQVDGWAARIENHETLVDAKLRELGAALARARVRQQRLEKDLDRLQEERRGAEHESERWRTRARGERDEVRALECLRRHRGASTRIAALDQRIAELETRLAAMRPNLKSLEEKATELRDKRDVMRSRAAQAEAGRLVRDSLAGPGAEIEGVFERWEERLLETELTDDMPGPDAFERAFDEQEDEQELRALLHSLREETGDVPNRD